MGIKTAEAKFKWSLLAVLAVMIITSILVYTFIDDQREWQFYSSFVPLLAGTFTLALGSILAFLVVAWLFSLIHFILLDSGERKVWQWIFPFIGLSICILGFLPRASLRIIGARIE